MMETVRSTAGLHGVTPQKIIFFYESIIYNEGTQTSKWRFCYTRRFGADQAYFCPQETVRSCCFVQLSVY
jgi:hypothetical protein